MKQAAPFAENQRLFLFTVEGMAVLRVVNFARKMRRDAAGNDCVVLDDGLLRRAKSADLHVDQAEAEKRVADARAAAKRG